MDDQPDIDQPESLKTTIRLPRRGASTRASALRLDHPYVDISYQAHYEIEESWPCSRYMQDTLEHCRVLESPDMPSRDAEETFGTYPPLLVSTRVQCLHLRKTIRTSRTRGVDCGDTRHDAIISRGPIMNLSGAC